MPDKFTKAKRSQIMSKIRGKHTKPEKKLRKILRLLELKYKLHYGKCKIDIAFPKQKIAIFVDGCFWHGCPIHYKLPKSNKHYWLPKIKANAKRDKNITKKLKTKGWRVIRVWEHSLK